ncbi:MAG: flagellar protein FlaG [Nitrospiraceae bacterium]
MIPEVANSSGPMTAGGTVETGQIRSQARPASFRHVVEEETGVGGRDGPIRGRASMEQVSSSNDSLLRYEVDPELHRLVVKVLNEKSGDIVQQIPPEEVLRVAKFLQGNPGQLVDERI